MNARLLLAATIFVASAAAAFADGVDGVLITQASAEAGNVTPGDAPGFPVTLSLPGLYKLASNLTVPAGFDVIGIEPAADDVTIDLNGYRLQSLGGLSFGIHSHQSNYTNITIRNGTIAGFSGSPVVGRGAALIEDLRVAGNHESGIVFEENTRPIAIVRNNLVFSTALTALDGFGIYCYVSCLIAGNTVASNKDRGITLFGSGLVTGNAVLNNGGDGIAGTNDVGSTGNVVFGNGPNVGEDSGSFDRNWCGVEC